MLYPLAKHYDRLAEQCPNCCETWLLTGRQSAETPTTADGVRKVIAGLRKIAESELIRARVRLCVVGLPSKG